MAANKIPRLCTELSPVSGPSNCYCILLAAPQLVFNNDAVMSSRQILSLQPRESGGGGGRSNDDIVTELAEELEVQIPASLEDDDAGATTFVVQVTKQNG